MKTFCWILSIVGSLGCVLVILAGLKTADIEHQSIGADCYHHLQWAHYSPESG
jgi:hypothetical protein